MFRNSLHLEDNQVVAIPHYTLFNQNIQTSKRLEPALSNRGSDEVHFH